jgi:hypothetical protein
LASRVGYANSVVSTTASVVLVVGRVVSATDRVIHCVVGSVVDKGTDRVVGRSMDRGATLRLFGIANLCP